MTTGDPVDQGESITRNSAFALATQLTTAAFTAVLTLYLARTLGPERFGVFGLALSVGGVLLLPADFGISQSAARFIAERHGKPAAMADVFRTAVRLKLMVATGVLVVMMATAGPVAALYDEPGLAWAIRGIALSVFGQAVMQLYNASAQALRKNSVHLRIVFSESAMEFAATIAIVSAGAGAAGAAFGRAAGYLFGAGVGLILMGRLLRQRGVPEGGRMPMRRIAAYGSALVIVEGAFAIFGEIDILLIGALLSASAAGLFQAASRIVVFLHYPGNALAAGIAPRLARTGTETPDMGPLLAGLRLLIILQAWLTVPVLVWATPIIDLLLGPAYSQSADVLRALSPYVFLIGIGPLVSVTVNYLGEARRRIPIALTAVALNAGIDVVLIPEIGIVAGAIGTDVAYFVYVPAHLWICRRLLGLELRPLALTLGRALFAAAAMAGVLFLFGTGPLAVPTLLVGGILATATFLACLLLTGEVTRRDLAELRQRLARSSS